MLKRGSRSLGIGMVCLLLVLSGCDCLKGCAGRSVDYSFEKTNQVLDRVEKSLGDEQDKAQKPVDADFVVEGEKVFYKGKLLPVLGKIEEWIAILGDELIHFGNSSERESYIWKQLGVMCLCDKGIVVQFQINFRNHNEKDLQDVVKKLRPNHYYMKDIIIDGAVINKDTPVGKLNYNKKGPKFKEGIFPTVYDYELPFGKDKSVSVLIELSRKEGVISFAMNWQ